MKRIKGQLPASTVLDFGCAPSPYGEVMVAFGGDTVYFLTFTACCVGAAFGELKSFWPEAALRQDDDAAEKIAARIFAGENVETAVRGTDMQTSVWEALISKVPAGNTVTYTGLAEMAGFSRAVRAVASAVARNPVPVVIPCHRVVRKSGEIGNFRYGTPMKKAMLKDESERR